jgi:hypothetical protein
VFSKEWFDTGKFNVNVSTTEQTEVKPEVADIFNSTPELSKLGTPEQYSQYLRSKGITQTAFHHSETDIESFKTFPEGYFSKALKSKGTHYPEADNVVFFVKKPLQEEFMSKRPFLGIFGLKINKVLNFNAGEKIGEGVHPGIDEGIKEAVIGNYDAVDFGKIRDNRTWSEVIAITNPNNAVKLGTKQDIEEFKKFVSGLTSAKQSLNTDFNPTNVNEDKRIVYYNALETKFGKFISYSIPYTDITIEGIYKPTYELTFEKGILRVNFDVGSVQVVKGEKLTGAEDIRFLIGAGKILEYNSKQNDNTYHLSYTPVIPTQEQVENKQKECE